MSIVEIKPGVALNRAVAEAIGLAYPFVDGRPCGLYELTPEGAEYRPVSDPAIPDDWVPWYSTDANKAFIAADAAVARVYAKGERHWDISTYVGRDERGWTCSLGDEDEREFAPTPALAICGAILRLTERVKEERQ